MPWVRFDDTMPEHRKIWGLSDAAFRLHVSAICWCNRHLTDGHIGYEEITRVANVRSPRRISAELVSSGLWKPTEHGWLIHNYLEYQPSAETVKQRRRSAAERQAKWKEKKQGGNAVTNASSPTGSNAVSNAYPNPTHSRPQEKGGSGSGDGDLKAAPATHSNCRRCDGHGWIEQDDGREARCPSPLFEAPETA